MDTCLVSVIIPTKNSSRTLESCLKSIKNQTYKNIEIIVVDNFSSDDTKQIALKYTDKVYEKWPERTSQKNYGIEKSSWEYICFIDSDMELSENVIVDCIDLYKKDSNIWGICIPEHSIWKWLFVKIREFERSFYEWTAIESARFFRLDDVKFVWWFEEDLIFFEESLLPQKIELKLAKACNIRTGSYINHNENTVSLYEWLQKKFYYGKSLKEYNQKVIKIWLEKVWKDQVSLINRYMIFLKNKKFYSRPILAIWVLFLKTMEFGAWWVWFLYSKFVR